MKKREAQIVRETSETKITLSLNIDGSGKRQIETPVNFLNRLISSKCCTGIESN